MARLLYLYLSTRKCKCEASMFQAGKVRVKSQLVSDMIWHIVFIIAGNPFATAKDEQDCYVNQLVPPCPVALPAPQQQPWLKSCGLPSLAVHLCPLLSQLCCLPTPLPLPASWFEMRKLTRPRAP